MKGRPIEVGCLVILTKTLFPENTGKIGKVVELCMAAADGHPNIWTVEFPGTLRYQQFGDVKRGNTANHPEPCMIRIDGDPDDHFAEDEQLHESHRKAQVPA